MPTFADDVIAAVLNHMNNDHPDDNLLIARAFGQQDAETATMIGLDDTAGFWLYRAGDADHELHVLWSTTISERPEIRREIVVLHDQACIRLGIAPRSH